MLVSFCIYVLGCNTITKYTGCIILVFHILNSWTYSILIQYYNRLIKNDHRNIEIHLLQTYKSWRNEIELFFWDVHYWRKNMLCAVIYSRTETQLEMILRITFLEGKGRKPNSKLYYNLLLVNIWKCCASNFSKIAP